MRKTIWSEAGNDHYKTGSIHRESIGYGWWILDWLLEKHELLTKIPGWDKFWSMVLPDYGDPFCAAYCFKWSTFYYRRMKQEYSVEVGFDKLSDEYKQWYKDK